MPTTISLTAIVLTSGLYPSATTYPSASTFPGGGNEIGLTAA